MLNRIALITACRLAFSAAIAFIVYTYFSWQYGYWSVITIAAVTVAGLNNTLSKNLLRFLGTLVGALAGYLLALLLAGHVGLVIPILFIGLIATSYLAIQPSHLTYSGLVMGLTMVIVIAASMQTGQLYAAAVYRTAEVIFGILVCTISGLIAWYISDDRSENPKNFSKEWSLIIQDIKNNRFDIHYLKIAIKIALAASITFALWIYWKYPGGYWATVSCLVIMEECTQKTQSNAWLRFFAHVIAALLGGIIALMIGTHSYLLIIPLTTVFFVCGYIIGLQKPYSKIGNIIAVALAVMLLVAPGESSTFTVLTARFLNTVFGIAVGLLTTRYLWPKH